MESELRARLPRLPYQIVLKLMTLVEPPVGIPEPRQDAIPRQIYDLDQLLAAVDDPDEWQAIRDYAADRYSYEATVHGVSPAADGPWAQITARLRYWADCTDDSDHRWRQIRSCQDTQLRREARVSPWGWRARALRVAYVVEVLSSAAPVAYWKQALRLADRVPGRGTKSLRTPLAALADRPRSALPLELHHFVWEPIALSKRALGNRLDQLEDALAGSGF